VLAAAAVVERASCIQPAVAMVARAASPKVVIFCVIVSLPTLLLMSEARAAFPLNREFAFILITVNVGIRHAVVLRFV
jgi:hypothetical protein